MLSSILIVKMRKHDVYDKPLLFVVVPLPSTLAMHINVVVWHLLHFNVCYCRSIKLILCITKTLLPQRHMVVCHAAQENRVCSTP